MTAFLLRLMAEAIFWGPADGPVVCRAINALNDAADDLDRDVERRTNGGVVCDMTSGPCACGAWHSPGQPFRAR